MKYRPASKFRLIVFLTITLSLWCYTFTLAESEPKDLEQVKVDEVESNSQFPKFLVLDKQNGRKTLIKIEKQLGGKESIQKETAGTKLKEGRIKCMVCGNKDDWGVCKDLNDVGVEKECPKAKHKSCYMIVHYDKETNQPKSKSRGCTDLEYNGSLCLAKGEVTESSYKQACFCSGNGCNGLALDEVHRNIASRDVAQ